MSDIAPEDTDILTPEQRHRCMSRIKGKNTKPEIILRKALWKKGRRYRIHYKILGRPDISFPSKRVAVFIDGCFWHGCPEHGAFPKKNAKFWKSKIDKNINRDKQVTHDLRRQGWTVLRYWEHEVISETIRVIEDIERRLDKV